MTPPTLVVVSQSHPFGSYVDFLEDELAHLAAAFAHVILLPLLAHGERQDVPSNVEVDVSVTQRLRSRGRRIAAGVRHAAGLRLIAAELRAAGAPRRHPQSLAHLLTASGAAAEVARWCAARRLPPSTVALTVWLGAGAVGTSAAGIRTVSRAHGGDLYEHRAPHGYLPMQRQAIEACEMVASVSEAGAQHLRRRYPSLGDRIVVRRLGIAGASRLAQASSDGVLRVVSCSSFLGQAY